MPPTPAALSQDRDPVAPASRGAASSGEARVARAVQRALAQHLHGGRASADVAHVVLAALTVFVFWSVVPGWTGLAWLAAFVLTAGARALNRHRAIRPDTEADEVLSVVRRDVWIAASLWGGWALLLTGVGTEGLLFLLLILAGLVAAGTSTLVADERSFLGFMGLLFGPLVLSVVATGLDRSHVSMLLLIGLFAPFMVVVHRRAHSVLTEQFRAAERLKISQEEMGSRRDFLNALVTSAPSSVVVLDAAGRVIRVNPAFERSLGFEASAAEGREFLPLVTEDRERTALATFLDTVQEGRAATADLPLRRADGSTLWMRLSGTLARGMAEGTAILMGEDVTEQVEARETQTMARIQAEEAARAKSAFLASMSHEIRTPMNGILGMVEILLDTPLTREQQNTAEVIRSSGEGLLRILNDVLDVSKIEAGQLDLETVDFDLHALVGEVGRVFAGAAAAAEDELLVDLGEGVPQVVRGDPHRIRQVLSNLVSNAVKFTRGGEVVISVRCLGSEEDVHRIEFRVRDTGIGIPPEKHEMVFRAFEQADSSTTRTHGGTGLGLSISRRLLELMGARLQLESAPGHGSEFHFVLGLEGGHEVRVEDTRHGGGATLSRYRYLVVDDNATARRIVREALAHAGATVEEAPDVERGLGMAREAAGAGSPFDVVILDHMMPGRDGFAFAREVHEDPGYGSPRVLMVTSGALAGGAEQARSLGVRGYMAKPVARSELLKALEALLGAPAREGAERRLVTRDTLSRVAGRARILLAEDNPVNQQVAIVLLQKRGHEVIAVGDGRQAVEAAQRDRFDLVLMDIQMPEMDGLEATRLIRRFADADTLPIVALTAHAFAEERERTRSAGMNDFLAKPFKPQDLYNLVDRWARLGVPLEGSDPVDDDKDMEMHSGDHAEPPVDLEGFRAMMREAGVEEVVDTTVDIYIEDAPAIYSEIVSGVTQGDADGVRRAAHSLKSSSGNIRANRLYRLLQELEDAGKGGDRERIDSLFPRIQQEFEAVMAYLRQATN